MLIINLQKKAVSIGDLPMKGLEKNLFWVMVLVDTKGGKKTMLFQCLIITMLDSMHVIGLTEFCMANHGLIGFMVIIGFVQIISSRVY